MIADSLDNSRQYENIAPGYKEAFDFCRQFSQAPKACGTYEIDGTRIYASVSEYDPVAETDMEWEGHRDYIDLQFLAEGSERIGWMPQREAEEKTEYDPEHDFQLFQDAPATFLRLGKNDFAIFRPEDIHKPKCICNEGSHNVKVVVKIHL